MTTRQVLGVIVLVVAGLIIICGALIRPTRPGVVAILTGLGLAVCAWVFLAY